MRPENANLRPIRADLRPEIVSRGGWKMEKRRNKMVLYGIIGHWPPKAAAQKWPNGKKNNLISISG